MLTDRILIVSKTKMHADYVCVGGVDIDNHTSVRLRSANGFNELSNECPYNIYEVWNIRYAFISNRSLPHSIEDVNVYQREKLGSIEQKDFLNYVQHSQVKIYEGEFTNVFDRCLQTDNGRSLFISKQNIPQRSTCFWISDKDMKIDNYMGKVRYSYLIPNHITPLKLPYVGLETNPIEIIPKGSLIRLSLAHWWKPGDRNVEERCYLQLSGYFLQN